MTKFQQIADSFLKKPDISGLPLRVREAIRRREWTNELLLRTIQLTIISIFCFIYAISPKTSPDGIFTPAPYVLATYFVLSVIGLVWGMLREPPDWSIYISILFDFCLLYGLMISFHIQYDQPASFILKAPALLYVFIFIAIRALRFNPKYVLTAGVVAIVGWAAVIFYVTEIDPGDNMLTRSYVEYLTANRILIGAEIDKILSIGFVTIILAVAVNGSSNLLITAIAEQSAADNLSRFFDTSIAKDIRSDRLMLDAGEGERRKVTVFNVDIRGFSQLSMQLEPSRVMSLLTAYRARINPIIQANGGVIDKFMGDGIMAIFGTNPQGEDEKIEASAINAAEQLLKDFGNWPADNPDLADFEYLQIGIGIA
ncbi:MAG: adenylate/guanylate cyclase domain-containing protein, partial [Rhizobiaceae bacterium]